MTDFDPTTDPDPARPGCEPGQSALQRLLDGEAAWDSPAAAAHRAACADCREELALARSMIRLPPDVIVPVGLTDRVLSAAGQAHRRRRLARYAGAGAALAASVLVVWLARPPRAVNPPDNGNAVAAVPPPRADDPAPHPAAPQKPLGEAVSEARDALVTLTRRTTSEPGERIGWLIPAPKLSNGPEAGDELQPLADARTGAARSVEPIRDSARRAVNFFIRAADPPDRAQP